jgi:CBS domain-containing protein
MPERARDLMTTPVLTVAHDAPLLEVQHLFVVAHISGAPIVDKTGKVLGIVSSSDLLRTSDQVHDDEIDPVPREKPDGAVERLLAFTASDVAAGDVVWVSPETPAPQVARLMRDEGVHRVLVGDNERLEGILTSFDLLRALAGSSTGDREDVQARRA